MSDQPPRSSRPSVPWTETAVLPGYGGDFVELLRARGLNQPLIATAGVAAEKIPMTEGTSIMALKFKDGVVVAGDRRATAGNLVVYDRADKVMHIDDRSILAIAGVPAMAWEMARVLQHSLRYYKRSQLQEMSLEGKLRSLSKLLKDNIPMALQGVGVVVPIFATYDMGEGRDGAGKVYFYDVLGAQFEGVDYCTSGSGSLAVRAVAYYLNNWGPRPFSKMTEAEAVTVALRLLDTAAESDTATGGYDRRNAVFPIVKCITRAGIRDVTAAEMGKVYRARV